MLLLDMGVEGWIAQISLWTIAALEVTTFDVILGAAFAFATAVIVVVVDVVSVTLSEEKKSSFLVRLPFLSLG